jgi:hypothetical protein
MIVEASHLPPSPLNLRRLCAAVEEAAASVRREVAEAMAAADVIDSGCAIAASFPDGSAPPPTPTPRQILFLAELAARHRGSACAE